jgi:hypothetical protein
MDVEELGPAPNIAGTMYTKTIQSVQDGKYLAITTVILSVIPLFFKAILTSESAIAFSSAEFRSSETICSAAPNYEIHRWRA